MTTAAPSTTDRKDRYPSRIQPKPTLIPRLDPVVYGDRKSPPPGITPQQVVEYETRGFVVLKGLFERFEIEHYQKELEGLSNDAGLQDCLEAITEPDSHELRSLFSFHTLGAGLMPLAKSLQLVEIARYLLDDDVYIHQSRINLKPGFRGKGFYWHSDFETWHVEDGMPRMQALSMSIALTENTTHNGPLMLMPGSHNDYVTCVGETPANNYKSSLKSQEIGVPDDESLEKLYQRYGIATPTGPAGNVTIFDCNTMHGSGSNISPLPRSNAFMVFNALSNRVEEPFCHQAPRPEFIATRESITPIV
ncbi:MAG: ectoine hydroxylase [Verrucomicrobiales bacterium]|jgi:ectoine hydroxylase